MKHDPLYVFGLIALRSFWFAATPAAGDTVGPYYAAPSWDQTLPSSTRFVVLSNMNGDAVLDRETGLVWERSPSPTFVALNTAISNRCGPLTTGGRLGWRVPRAEELGSLLDPTQFHSPTIGCGSAALPVGHPFNNVCQGGYWTVSTVGPGISDSTLIVFVHNGGINNTSPVDDSRPLWCVRGGNGSSAPVTSP